MQYFCTLLNTKSRGSGDSGETKTGKNWNKLVNEGKKDISRSFNLQLEKSFTDSLIMPM